MEICRGRHSNSLSSGSLSWGISFGFSSKLIYGNYLQNPQSISQTRMSVQSVKPWWQSLSRVTWPPHDDLSWCPLFLCFNHKFPIFYSPTSKMCCSWRNLRTHIQWQWHQQKRPLMERLTGMGSEGAVEDVHCYADFCFLFFFWEYILMLNWASEKA